jgi:GNAT superfamily N-acetyltransferase
MAHPFRIRRLPALDEAVHLRALAEVLVDCVDGGGSVSFMWPLSLERAEAFWRSLAAGVASQERALIVAEDGAGEIVGTVQLALALPENQPHRADVCKMLVHRRARRQGVGAALMKAAEETARGLGKTLLVLDTIQGGDAERLYLRLGWELAGRIPNYALLPRGGLCATSIFFKQIG